MVRIVGTLAPAALRSLESLARGAAALEARAGDVEAALEEVAKVEAALRDLLAELKEWGDIRTIVRKLEELLRTEKQLEESVKIKISETLGNENPK